MAWQHHFRCSNCPIQKLGKVDLWTGPLSLSKFSRVTLSPSKNPWGPCFQVFGRRDGFAARKAPLPWLPSQYLALEMGLQPSRSSECTTSKILRETNMTFALGSIGRASMTQSRTDFMDPVQDPASPIKSTNPFCCLSSRNDFSLFDQKNSAPLSLSWRRFTPAPKQGLTHIRVSYLQGKHRIQLYLLDETGSQS